MSAIWKLLGAAAALAGLAPYKVNKDEETGEVKVKALLWNATYAPATEEKAKTVDVHFGLNVPGKEKKENETHIYTDDVTVSYAAEEKAGENAEAAPEAAEEKAEEAAPAAEPAEEKPEEAAPAAEAAEGKPEEPAPEAEATEEKPEEPVTEPENPAEA